MNKHLFAFALTPLLLLPFCINASNAANASKAETSEKTNENELGLKLYQVESPYSFHTVLQEKYLNEGTKNVTKYAKGVANLDKPESLKIEWDAKSKSKNDKPYYTLSISESSDMSSSDTYSSNYEWAYVYNLKLATKYYYQVKATLNGTTSYSEIKYFWTDNSMIRNLNIDGVINMRDIGGWRDSNGEFMVKQGMIYRSGPFNASYSSVATITAQGRKDIKKLGIKTEIDLRTTKKDSNGNIEAGINRSVLSGVSYVSAPIDYSYPERVFETGDNAASIKKIFSTLANIDNYPIDFHCTVGTDRTGLIAYLINGLMGVGEADLYRDYLFSNFANISGFRERSSINGAYVKAIKGKKGKSLQAKIVNTLKEIGVTSDELNSIYYIMKGESYRI